MSDFLSSARAFGRQNPGRLDEIAAELEPLRPFIDNSTDDVLVALFSEMIGILVHRGIPVAAVDHIFHGVLDVIVSGAVEDPRLLAALRGESTRES